MCHAAEPVYEGIYHAPKGVMLDTDAAIANHAREIYLQAGRSHAMPPANVIADYRQGAGAAGRLVRRRGKVSMTSTLLRGRTLSFVRWPETIDDNAAWRYEEDGGLLIRDGRIVAAGAYAQVEKQAGEAAKRSITGRI